MNLKEAESHNFDTVDMEKVIGRPLKQAKEYDPKPGPKEEEVKEQVVEEENNNEEPQTPPSLSTGKKDLSSIPERSEIPDSNASGNNISLASDSLGLPVKTPDDKQGSIEKQVFAASQDKEVVPKDPSLVFQDSNPIAKYDGSQNVVMSDPSSSPVKEDSLQKKKDGSESVVGFKSI